MQQEGIIVIHLINLVVIYVFFIVDNNFETDGVSNTDGLHEPK